MFDMAASSSPPLLFLLLFFLSTSLFTISYSNISYHSSTILSQSFSFRAALVPARLRISNTALRGHQRLVVKDKVSVNCRKQSFAHAVEESRARTNLACTRPCLITTASPNPHRGPLHFLLIHFLHHFLVLDHSYRALELDLLYLLPLSYQFRSSIPQKLLPTSYSPLNLFRCAIPLRRYF
jgi:hypothetical protein